jgi:hypothetical protein
VRLIDSSSYICQGERARQGGGIGVGGRVLVEGTNACDEFEQRKLTEVEGSVRLTS